MVESIPRELLVKVRNKTMIERIGHECEDTVIRELVRGNNISQIVDILQKKWPKHEFTYDKVRAFIQKNAEIKNLVTTIDKKIARRQAELNINYQERLYNLLVMAEDRLKDMVKRGCTDVDFFRGLKGNVQALYAHKKILGGPISGSSHSFNVNIIQQISADKQDLRTKVLQAKTVVPDTPLDVTAEVEVIEKNED